MLQRQLILFDTLLDLLPVDTSQLSLSSIEYLNEYINFTERTITKFNIFISSQYSIHFFNQILLQYQSYLLTLNNKSNANISTVKWKNIQIIVIQILRYFLLNKTSKVKLEISEESNFIIYFLVYKYNYIRCILNNEIMNKYTKYNSICYITNIYYDNNNNFNIPIDLSMLFYYLFNSRNDDNNKYISDFNIIEKECEEIIKLYCNRIDTNSLKIIINKNIENELIQNNSIEFCSFMNEIFIENIKKYKSNIILKKENIQIIINLMYKFRDIKSIFDMFIHSLLILNENDKEILLIIWEMIKINEEINNNDKNMNVLLLELFYFIIIHTPLQLSVKLPMNENTLNKKLLGIKQPDKPIIYNPKSKLLIKQHHQQQHLKLVNINDVYEFIKNEGKEFCHEDLLIKYNELFKSYGLDEVRYFSNIKNGRKIDNLKVNKINIS